MSENIQSALTDLMESEALEKYYIDKAVSPGITIQCGVFTAPDAKRGQIYTVYFSTMAHWNYNKLSDARKKAEEILSKAQKPIEVTVKNRQNKVIRSLSFSPLNNQKVIKGEKHE